MIMEKSLLSSASIESYFQRGVKISGFVFYIGIISFNSEKEFHIMEAALFQIG